MSQEAPLRAKPLILHIDDMQEVLLSTKVMLEALGVDSISANTAKDGLELAKRQLPDLVLMDVRMPEIDGHKATRILRGDPATRHIPILMVTGSDTKDDVERAIAEGANGYVIKPLHLDRLKAKIGEWVRLP